MASPHVAGAVALLLEGRPGTRPREVQRRLQNTARPAAWWGFPSLGLADNVHRQGAGMLRIDDAVKAHATVSPSSLALGEIEAGAVTNTLRISLAAEKRSGPGRNDPPVTYTLGHQPAVSTGPSTFVPAFYAGFATAAFSVRSVTLGGRRGHDDDEATIDVTISPPPDSTTRLFGGYITLTPNDGGIVLRVPYAGYNGDYQQIAALTPTTARVPLARQARRHGPLQPAGRCGIHARRRRHSVHPVPFGPSGEDAEDGGHQCRDRPAGRLCRHRAVPAPQQHGDLVLRVSMGRDHHEAGRRQPKRVPNGSYRIDLSVLKAWAIRTTRRTSSTGCRRRSSSAGPSVRGRTPIIGGEASSDLTSRGRARRKMGEGRAVRRPQTPDPSRAA